MLEKIVKEVKKSDGLWCFACGDVFIQKWEMFQYKLKESQTVYEKVWFERMNRIKNEKERKRMLLLPILQSWKLRLASLRANLPFNGMIAVASGEHILLSFVSFLSFIRSALAV